MLAGNLAATERFELTLADAPPSQIGPYVVDREWGVPREDYSPDGNAWAAFPHSHARSRAYRWGEDGIAGVCNRFQNWAMALALWNGKDPILKERFFGLAGPEGNHGEDAKEIWANEDATPCATWLRMRYVYPMQRFPYEKLVEQSAARTREEPEPELPDALEGGMAALTGGEFWDVTVEYGKASADEVLMRVRARNCRPASAGDAGTETIHILPTLWFRNTWSWGYDQRRPAIRGCTSAPEASSAPVAESDCRPHGYEAGAPPAAPWPRADGAASEARFVAWERHNGGMRWAVTVPEHLAPGSSSHSPGGAAEAGTAGASGDATGGPVLPGGSTTDASTARQPPRGTLARPVELLVTDNETNFVRVFGEAAREAQDSAHTKDAFHDVVTDCKEPCRGQVKPPHEAGTKAAAWVALSVPAGACGEVWCRLKIEGRRLDEDGVGERTRRAAAYAARAAVARAKGCDTSATAPPVAPASPVHASAAAEGASQLRLSGSMVLQPERFEAAAGPGGGGGVDVTAALEGVDGGGQQLDSLLGLTGTPSEGSAGDEDFCFNGSASSALAERDSAGRLCKAPEAGAGAGAGAEAGAGAGAEAAPAFKPAVDMLASLPIPEATPMSELVAPHDAARDAALELLADSDRRGVWAPWQDFAQVMEARRREADAFYAALQPPGIADEDRRLQRQALAGLIWGKGFYHFGVQMWLDGDPRFPPPPDSRLGIRNGNWRHLYVASVVSLPDSWEYPFFAVWDLAFHMIPMAVLDGEWAKRQLLLFMREWMMHPSGCLPAYEWSYGDLNPPVHAWACLRVFQITRQASGQPDVTFLERAFHKLLLNFQFWTNKVDAGGKNLFGGGFLGLDNASPINRSELETTPGLSDLELHQADGTAWMAFFCSIMLKIALELAEHRDAYVDIANKFLEHFILISHACDALWDEEDEFYYDWAHVKGDRTPAFPIRVRSYVGLIPLFASLTISDETLRKLPAFQARMAWFLRHRSSWCASHVYSGRGARSPVLGVSITESAADLVREGIGPQGSADAPAVGMPVDSAPATAGAGRLRSKRSWAPGSCASLPGSGSSEQGATPGEGVHLLTLVSPERIRKIVSRMLDPEEFLAPHGIRSLSRYHLEHPYTFRHNGHEAGLRYEPGDSSSPLYGGNSNWRGPIWIPINHLLIEALQRLDHFFGDGFTVPLPTGSAEPPVPLWDVGSDISDRLVSMFRQGGAREDTASRAPRRPASRPAGAAAGAGEPATGTTRPAYGSVSPWMDQVPALRELHQFYEFFHGESGAGHGAAHQTGWTAGIAKLIQQLATTRRTGLRR